MRPAKGINGLMDHPFGADYARRIPAPADKMLAALNQPYQLGVYVYHSTPSMGATLFLDDSEGVDAIFKRADTAMYQVKTSGRNALRFFSADLQRSRQNG